MKNKFQIVLLFLTLLGQAAYSQKTLPRSLQPYAENWTYTMVKSMHRAGFDMPTMPATTPVISQGANGGQLDSTKTFFEYTQAWGGDSTPIFRSTFEYPQPATMIETNFQYDQGQWQPLNRSTIMSDDQKRLLEVMAEVYDTDSQTFRPDSRVVIFPHGDSPELIDSFLTALWDSTIMDWRILVAHENFFDTQDRILESVTLFENSGNPLIFKEVYAYNANGENHLIEEFELSGNEVIPTHRTEIKYVVDGPLEVLLLVAEGDSFIQKSRTNYAYNLFGAPRKQMEFKWNAEQKRFYLFETTDFAYDSFQRLSTKGITWHTREERQQTHYGYLGNMNLYVEFAFTWDDDLFDWVLETKKYYYYSGLVSLDPGPIAVQPLELSPNPTAGLARLNLEGPAYFQLYNTGGALVSSGEYQPDDLLNLVDLPNGLYFITARSETGVYAGRIVKQ
jgi:hypothetical protein